MVVSRAHATRRAGRAAWIASFIVLALASFVLAAAIAWRLSLAPQAPPDPSAPPPTTPVEPGAPAPPPQDELLASAARLAEAGKLAEAVVRYGEAAAKAPTDPRPLLGRARARGRLGPAEAALADADLRKAIEVAPGQLDAYLLLAELRLQRGDARGAGDALDRALDACPTTPDTVRRIAELRRLQAAEQDAERALLDRAEAALRTFHTLEAESSLSAAVRSGRGDSPAVQALLARVKAQLGRYDDALAAMREVLRVDTAAPIDETSLELLRKLARDQAGAPLRGVEPAGWDGFQGGTWREESGIISARGAGLGQFDLAALLAPEAPSGANHALFVEVDLVGGNERYGAYAGVLLGGRDVDDYLTVYIFRDPAALREAIRRGEMTQAELDRYREAHGGALPKFVRVASMVRGSWSHIATEPVDFPDQGFVPLEVRAESDRLIISVNGVRLAGAIACPRPLDGRVGLVKWYETQARFRGWVLR